MAAYSGIQVRGPQSLLTKADASWRELVVAFECTHVPAGAAAAVGSYAAELV